MFKKLILTAAASLAVFGAAAILPSSGAGTQVIGSLIAADAASYDISSYTASIPYSSYTYRGRGIKPTVTVKDKSGNKLTKDTDFTVSYSNNTNVGTATITIKGKGKYTGTLKKTFKVKPLDLSTSYAKVTIPYSSYTYSGSAIKPAVKVKFKDGDIIPTAQYTLSYSNNVKVGTATITVKGKGSNVTGTYKKTFVVKPEKNSIKSLTSTPGAFKLTWEKATVGATGYQVLYSTDMNFENNVHSYTSTDLSDLSENFSKVPNEGETWYVKIRSFVTKDGKTTSTRYGNYSAVKSVSIPYSENKLKEMMMNSTSQKMTDWFYGDFDGDGDKEAFAGFSEIYYVVGLRFIDSNGKITELSGLIGKGGINVLNFKGKKFVTVCYGEYQVWRYRTLVFSVKNDSPYELKISNKISDLYIRNGVPYTHVYTVRDMLDFDEKEKMLGYDSYDQEFIY